ncbi:hypothetical protein ACFQV2_36250 [Actinokineospora soli]|uniref:TPM domain-containing protein n=1 Tax=Actinokineospora soli TaxID=1048753 RepID=A0ABW2TVX3_9PSEU
MTRLLLAVLAALLLAAPAAAEPPLRLPGQITDDTGALATGRADVQGAIDRLYDERRLRLWVVYVERFDTPGWAERTAGLSALGDRDVLLAVATVDREYALFSPACPPRSPTPSSTTSGSSRWSPRCAAATGRARPSPPPRGSGRPPRRAGRARCG